MNDTKVATKADIKDLKSDSKSIRSELLRVEEKVEDVQDEIKAHRTENKNDIKELRTGMTDKLDKIANTLDGFVGRVDNLTVDNEVGAHHTRELELKVAALERRVKQLESARQTS